MVQELKGCETIIEIEVSDETKHELTEDEIYDQQHKLEFTEEELEEMEKRYANVPF